MLTLPLTREISVTDISMETPCPPDIKQAWAQAEAKRPEMVFYDGMIKSSAMREDAIAVRNLPTVYAGAGYAYTENRYMLHEGNAYIQIGAKMDLYDGGAQGADLEKERARQDQLKEQKYKFIDDIRFEVKNGFVGLSDALEKREVAQEALAQAEENVRYYRAKYNNGAAISTEVLEAISMETGAATNFHVADYDVKRSYARLMYSSGEDIASIYTDRTER
jgi:outer membrane protein TolC